MCTKTVIHLKDYWYSIVATHISVNYYGIRIDEKIHIASWNFQLDDH